jgi:ribosomal protein S18 acetylase RimI-like enzyme
MVAGKVVTIRAANTDDFDVWFALFEAVAAEGKWVGSEAPLDRDSRRRSFDHYLESADAVTLLAEVDGQLVGDLGIEIRRGVGHLGMLVDERWRGRGVGSTLMESCINWAEEHGGHKISLEVWPHNVAAIGLYKKFGFEQEGLQLRHYRRRSGQLWDAITMGLVLDSNSPGSPFAPGS